MSLLIGIIALILVGVFLPNDTGELWIFATQGLLLFVAGIIAVVGELVELFLKAVSENPGKKEKKSAVGILFTGIGYLFYIGIGCMMVFWGGKDIVFAVSDVINGAQEVHLEKCEVSKVKHIKRGTLYYLDGMDDGKEVLYSINEDTYYEYEDEHNFSIDIIVWRKSEIIKEIPE